YWGNVLFQRCLKSEKFRKQLDSAVKDIKSYLTKERMTEMAKKYASVVKPYVYSMPDIMYTHLNQSQYNTVAKAITEEIDDNYRRYKESLKKPMPFYIANPRVNNGKFLFEWESSFDFNYEEITYSFELARDVNFRNVILKEENLSIAATETEKLPRGQYFIRVISTNESGLSQYAFDYYVTETGKHYGVKCFYVDNMGKIVEDVYVEN
ncbi:MAG: CotH kinase family protein, partial [Clostridia bacterium]|nr:CotH kinase family protein [Clostridia bacterium]